MRVRALFLLSVGIAAPLWAQNPTGSADSVSAGAIVAEAKKIGPPPAVLTLAASLSERTITVMQGDSAVAVYQVAIGADKHPTPTGNFRIRRIVWNPRWVPPDEPWARGKSAKDPGHPANPMKVVKIFFKEPDYYIHGTGDLNSLGSAASHGCLRMDPDQAAEVAKWVMLHGGQPREEGWFQRILHFRREEQTVYLEKPVLLVITP